MLELILTLYQQQAIDVMVAQMVLLLVPNMKDLTVELIQENLIQRVRETFSLAHAHR